MEKKVFAFTADAELHSRMKEYLKSLDGKLSMKDYITKLIENDLAVKTIKKEEVKEKSKEKEVGEQAKKETQDNKQNNKTKGKVETKKDEKQKENIQKEIKCNKPNVKDTNGLNNKIQEDEEEMEME